MRTTLLCALLLLGGFACAGLAKDITKGASSTEREVNGRRNNNTTSDEAGAPAPSGTGTPAD
jgi:hypothetical protein